MKCIAKALLITLLCFQSIGIALAQDKTSNFKEGVIQYKIEVEGAAEYSPFVENSFINLYLKDDNVNMDISIMGGMATFQLINNIQNDLVTLLMDVPAFYEKTAIGLDKNSNVFKELNPEKTKNKAPEKAADVQYFKNKKKRIAKYPCYKAEMPMNDGSNGKITVYLTDKLRPAAMESIEKTMGKMEGFPMAFEMVVEGYVLRITAVDVDKRMVEKEIFEVPESYNKKTLDEFKSEMQEKMGGEGSAIIGL
jgi:hypothetical protein